MVEHFQVNKCKVNPCGNPHVQIAKKHLLSLV